MSTTLDKPALSSRTATGTSDAQRLRTATTAVRLSFTWFGTRKSLSSDQQAQATDAFGAERDCLSASKRLLDVKHPAMKAVTTVKSRAVSYWKAVSLPFPETGVRLIRQDRIEAFNRQLEEFREELDIGGERGGTAGDQPRDAAPFA